MLLLQERSKLKEKKRKTNDKVLSAVLRTYTLLFEAHIK